ncbi:MAG: hypothetical protein HYY64_11500 [Candidatus Rokubacteria bacterium]|nr:hypothetical protein [Candidatus Rokubacteria bacterium]
MLIGLVTANPATGHERPQQRPAAKGAIDPAQSFQFLVLSGAGGHFHTLLLSPDLRTLFAGTHLGLFRSEDRGLTWRLAASRFSGEDVHALAWDPRGGVLYAATHGQGLLLGRNRGARWHQADGLPGGDLHALALAHREPHVLYVWVVGHGLFRSDDGATRWRRVAGPEVLTGVESLAVHPEQSERLYAGTAKGVWVSEDSGRRWRLPAGGLPHRAAGVSVPPWQPDLLLAATLEGAFGGKVDGTGWKPLPSHPSWWGLLTGFAFLSQRPQTVFAVTHEGVVAAWRLTGGSWVPAAELPVGEGGLSRR